MTEAEGRYRERRSAHASEEEAAARPAPPEEPEQAPETPAREPAGDRGPVIETSTAEPRAEAERSPFPEGPFFEVVQYVVLRASQCLGEIPFDETGEKRVLPREAKGYIDLLSALHERTRGDLSKEAASALDNVLSDLRMRYLELG